MTFICSESHASSVSPAACPQLWVSQLPTIWAWRSKRRDAWRGDLWAHRRCCPVSPLYLAAGVVGRQGSVPSISPHSPCPHHQCKACTSLDIDPFISPPCCYLLISSIRELPFHAHGFVPSALALFRYQMISAGSLPCLQTGCNPNCFP